MELIVATIGLENKIIDENTFSILVLIAVTTTLAAMPIYNLSLKNHPPTDTLDEQMGYKPNEVLRMSS
jgi:hypothetical protein